MIVLTFLASFNGKSYHGREYDVSPILSLFSVNKAASKKGDVYELISKFTSNMFDKKRSVETGGVPLVWDDHQWTIL